MPRRDTNIRSSLFGKGLSTLHTNSLEVFSNANKLKLFKMYFCAERHLGVVGRIILKLILQKQDVRVCPGLMWLKTKSSVADSCEHGNEPSLGIYKKGNFLTSRATISF
jgi:hypothetical protein